MQDPTHLLPFTVVHDAVRVGDTRQREGKSREVVGGIRVVLLQQVQHPARALRHHFAQRLHVAVFEVQDAIGDIEYAVVVGNEDDRGSVLAGEILDQLDDIASRLLVQRGGRLVGEDHSRSRYQRACDAGSLFLAAG